MRSPFNGSCRCGSKHRGAVFFDLLQPHRSAPTSTRRGVRFEQPKIPELLVRCPGNQNFRFQTQKSNISFFGFKPNGFGWVRRISVTENLGAPTTLVAQPENPKIWNFWFDARNPNISVFNRKAQGVGFGSAHRNSKTENFGAPTSLVASKFSLREKIWKPPKFQPTLKPMTISPTPTCCHPFITSSVESIPTKVPSSSEPSMDQWLIKPSKWIPIPHTDGICSKPITIPMYPSFTSMIDEHPEMPVCENSVEATSNSKGFTMSYPLAPISTSSQLTPFWWIPLKVGFRGD